MTTITKSIDIRLTDYDVEIELDADDLSECDTEDLFEALNKGAGPFEIADLALDDTSLRNAILRRVSEEHASEAVQAWWQSDEDLIADAFDAATDEQRVKLTQHIADSSATMLDARKACVSRWLGYDSETASMRPDESAQSLATYTREVLGLDTDVVDVRRAPLVDIVAAFCRRSENLGDLIVALTSRFGPQYVLNTATAECTALVVQEAVSKAVSEALKEQRA